MLLVVLFCVCFVFVVVVFLFVFLVFPLFLFATRARHGPPSQSLPLPQAVPSIPQFPDRLTSRALIQAHSNGGQLVRLPRQQRAQACVSDHSSISNTTKNPQPTRVRPTHKSLQGPLLSLPLVEPSHSLVFKCGCGVPLVCWCENHPSYWCFFLQTQKN